VLTLDIGARLLAAVVVLVLAGLVNQWWKFRVLGRRRE
jgi:hypothetical protein